MVAAGKSITLGISGKNPIQAVIPGEYWRTDVFIAVVAGVQRTTWTRGMEIKSKAVPESTRVDGFAASERIVGWNGTIRVVAQDLSMETGTGTAGVLGPGGIQVTTPSACKYVSGA